MASDSDGGKRVPLHLRSNDNEEFLMEPSAARLSKLLEHMMEDGCAGDVIPLPPVKGAVLAKVLEYCHRHASAAGQDLLRRWDEEFMKVDTGTLCGLINAANYMEINGLLKLSCSAMANVIKGKSPEEMRAMFNLKNDFPPEEEEEIRSQCSWAFK